MAGRKGTIRNVAETADRLILRRNVKLANDRYLIFDKEDGLWRVAYYRKRYTGEDGHFLTLDLQDSMERSGMLPHKPRLWWARFTTKAPTLATGIWTVLNEAGQTLKYNEIIAYIKSVDWAWYLEA